MWRRTFKRMHRLIAMNVQVSTAYRAAFVVYMVNAILAPLLSMLVWLTVAGQGAALPYDRQELVTYFILVSVVSVLTASWLADWVAEQIRFGGLSSWLLLPVPYIVFQAANNVGEKLVKGPILCPLILLVVLLFGNDVRFPTDPWVWVRFVCCLPLTATVSFLLDFVVGSLAFWLHDVRGLIRAKALVGSALAGQLIPLSLFPSSFSLVLEIQPFRYTLAFPIEILIGHLDTAALVRGFWWQLAYCVALYCGYRLIWRYGLRAYTASGA